MTPEEYTLKARRTRTIYDRKRIIEELTVYKRVQLVHAVFGISDEAGELCGQMEKWLFYNQELDTSNIVEELGDLMWYIVTAADAVDTTLEEIMEKNIQKLKVRYPDKYTDHDAKEENRDREAEAKAMELQQLTHSEEPKPIGYVYQDGIRLKAELTEVDQKSNERMEVRLTEVDQKSKERMKVREYLRNHSHQCPHCGAWLNEDMLTTMMLEPSGDKITRLSKGLTLGGCPDCNDSFELEDIVRWKRKNR